MQQHDRGLGPVVQGETVPDRGPRWWWMTPQCGWKREIACGRRRRGGRKASGTSMQRTNEFETSLVCSAPADPSGQRRCPFSGREIFVRGQFCGGFQFGSRIAPRNFCCATWGTSCTLCILSGGGTAFPRVSAFFRMESQPGPCFFFFPVSDELVLFTFGLTKAPHNRWSTTHRGLGVLTFPSSDGPAPKLEVR